MNMKEPVMQIPVSEGLILENAVAMFLTNIINESTVTLEGDLIVPFEEIAALQQIYLKSKKNRLKYGVTAKTFGVDDFKKNVVICKYCSSDSVSIQRSPDGHVICNDCGSSYRLDKQAITECLYCGSHSIDVRDGQWECRDCGSNNKNI